MDSLTTTQLKLKKSLTPPTETWVDMITSAMAKILSELLRKGRRFARLAKLKI